MTRLEALWKKWISTPIVLEVNPKTGKKWGDDGGYRKMRTLPYNPSPLAVPSLEIRSVYDGIDEYTGDHAKVSPLPGGLAGGKQMARTILAQGFDLGDMTLRSMTGNALGLVAYDLFRSEKRQAGGFTAKLLEQLSKRDVDPSEVHGNLLGYIQAGKEADGVFSFVNLDMTSPAYNQVIDRLKEDVKFMVDVEDVASELGIGKDALLEEYVTFCSNSGLGQGTGVPLNGECNAHLGAGAGDAQVLDVKTGLPLSKVPFDYSGPISAMDFLEPDENYDVYIAAAKSDPVLAEHLKRIGYPTPDTFTFENWKKLRAIKRAQYHLMVAMGFTFYSAEDASGGEDWHWEAGNIITHPLTGDVVYSEPLTAALYPNAGNPGHTLQKLGKDAVAIWGAANTLPLALAHGLGE